MTEILKSQTWSLTCAVNSVPALREGFYAGRDMAGSIDAPDRVPSGSTVENIVTLFADINGRYVIGGLAYRD